MNTKAGNAQPEPANDDQIDAIQLPSLITQLHVQERVLSKVAGSPLGWKKLTQLEQAYRQERLGAKDSKEARQRRAAGEEFTLLWDCAQSAGRDSTAVFDVGRCMGSGTPLSERQRDAISRLVQIEMHLGQRDRTIIRAFCAMGHSPAEAIALARLPNDTRVTARLCEALDALVDAIERTEKRGRR